MGNVVETPVLHSEAIEHPLSWGPVIRGVRYDGGPDAAILLHEPRSDLDAWKTLPVQLSRQLEIETLNFDLPGHGLSDGHWEPARLPDLLRKLPELLPAAKRRFVISAGATSLAALELSADLELSGIVCLSPDEPDNDWRPVRSPKVPKLIVAGSMAGNDLVTARRLASACGGWAVVTSLPVIDRGTRLLGTIWGRRLEEEIVAFLRDCQRRPA